MSDQWEGYGRAVIRSMSGVIEEAAEEHHPLLLETADYWLSLGITIGLGDRERATRLLELIEAHEPSRTELEEDATSFLDEALG